MFLRYRIMSRKEIILDDHIDKCYVYSILCLKSYSYYNRLKFMFQMPIILFSSALSIINSNMSKDESNNSALNIVNISVNVCTAIVLVINNSLKFEARANHFKTQSSKFIKLQNDIEKYVINRTDDSPISQDFLNGIMTSYENVVDNMMFDVPSSICKVVRNKYKEKRTLPLIVNGIKKKDEHRDLRKCQAIIAIEEPTITKTEKLIGQVVYTSPVQ